MSGETTMTCDACGKKEPWATAQGTGRYSNEKQKFDNGWWVIKSDTRHSRRFTFDRTSFDCCSWACAKQIHAKLAEVEFDRKNAENEAKCLQWALDQAGIKAAELEAKSNEVQSLNERIRSLTSQLQATRGNNHESLADENAHLIRQMHTLEEELKQVRKLDREELAFIFREAIRAERSERVDVPGNVASGYGCSDNALPSDRSEG